MYDIEGFFDDQVEDDTIILPPDYESRIEMSCTTFKKVDQCFQLDAYVDRQVGEDAYKPIRRFLNAINACKVDIINPGHYIVVDERMSSWKGYETAVSGASAVHITKIQRKPKK